MAFFQWLPLEDLVTELLRAPGRDAENAHDHGQVFTKAYQPLGPERVLTRDPFTRTARCGRQHTGEQTAWVRAWLKERRRFWTPSGSRSRQSSPPRDVLCHATLLPEVELELTGSGRGSLDFSGRECKLFALAPSSSFRAKALRIRAQRHARTSARWSRWLSFGPSGRAVRWLVQTLARQGLTAAAKNKSAARKSQSYWILFDTLFVPCEWDDGDWI